MEYKDLKPEMSGKECLIDLPTCDYKDVPAMLVLYDGSWYACQDAHNGIFIPNRHGKKYSYYLDAGNCRNIRLLPRTILDVQFEDVIVRSDEKRKVLARINDIVFTSRVNDYDTSSIIIWHVKELEKSGYTLEENHPEEEVIVTMDEIARMKGVDVSRIKVKKD